MLRLRARLSRRAIRDCTTERSHSIHLWILCQIRDIPDPRHPGRLPSYNAGHAPEHGLHRLEERSALHDALHQLFPPRPATSKKVYETAMVLTSFGSFGSTTNTTGMRRTSPGPRVCCVKQKHSTFWKYSPARGGP